MKKDIMDILGKADEAELEKLAEDSPLPDEAMKKRIVKKCMTKVSPEFAEAGDSAGGTEVYRRPRWAGFAAAAAAIALLVAGGAGIVKLGKNMKKTAPMPLESSTDTVTSPAAVTIENPSAAPDEDADAEEAASESKVTATAYVAGANETSTVSVEAPEEATIGNDDIQPEAKAPENSSSNDEHPWVIHLPVNGALPYGYWNSTGSYGEMSWHFYSTLDGAMGECAMNGEYYGFFNYTSDNGRITINWYEGKLACTAMKGTISGMVNGPTDPFDITWDGGGSDHFTYNPTGDLGIVTTNTGGGDLAQTSPPDNGSSPSGYSLGTFYWKSTGSLGSRSWSFTAGANAGKQGSVGGIGQYTVDGFWADSFNYHAENGRITITSQNDYTTLSGTINGSLYNSAAPFDIVWDNGGTDHFTYNFTETIAE